VEFEWDEAKRRSNLRKHGIDFVGIEVVFEGATVSILDDRADYGEERFVTFGLLDGRVVAVAHTETGTAIRVISVEEGNER
jgi:uncharacterized DUF497 family protein